MKKGLALLLAAVFCVATVTGCGSSEAETKADAAVETTAEGEAVALTVAASPTPHAEILNQAKDLLAEKGIELKDTREGVIWNKI